MYPICRLKNISGEAVHLHLKTFEIDEVLTVADIDRMSWASNDDTLVAITHGKIAVYNATAPVAGISNQIDYLKGY